MSRSKSSQSWLREHHDDSFVLKARREGFRSRAVYKLEEIQKKDNLLKPGQCIVDLGAAPGGWCEYASSILQGKGQIIGIDLLPVEPVADVELIQGDFTEQSSLDRIIEILGQSKIDVVLSDMAPNLSGMDSVDQPRAIYLAELAVNLCETHLAKEGAFVCKLFQGEGFEQLMATVKSIFKQVKFRKPEASRARSREIYIVCRGLK